MRKHLLAVLFLVILACCFFYSLFYPHLAMYSFPDYGQSDLWQQTYPAKYFLAESLKKGELPLWNPYVGSGYPEFAKAEIGALYLPNMVFLLLFPFPIAINLLYIVTFLIASVSMYFLCIRWKLSSQSALIASVVFAYSTFFLTKFPHLSRIESASLLPLMMLMLDRLMEKPTLKRASLYALVAVQQIYAGHFQMMFISALVLVCYVVFQTWVKRGYNAIVYVLVSGFLIALLAAIQLLPSIEFIQTTSRGAGFSPSQSLLYSFPWKNLATLIDPFMFGSPHNATFQLHNFFEGNIFWENSLFMSIPGLILLCVGLAQVHMKRKKLIFFMAILLCAGILLMTGKYSPLYLIHSVKPFSFFRAPSKYIFIVIFTSSVLAGYGYQYVATWIHRKNISNGVFIVVMGIIIFQLYSFYSQYVITDTPEHLLHNPTIERNVPKDDQYRYASYSSPAIWNKNLVKYGWADMSPYNALQGALVPNLNVLYRRYSFDAYRILLTRRTQTSLALSDTLYALRLQGDEHARAFNNFMDMQSVRTLIDIDKNDLITYQKRPNAVPRFHFAHTVYHIETVQDMVNVLAREDFSAKNTAFVEKKLPQFSHTSQNTILSIDESPQRITLKVDVSDETLGVITDTYYSGWNAYVDGKKVDMFPVNVNQRGILIGKGAQEVSLRYEPKMYLYGKYLTALGYAIIGLLSGWSFLQEYRLASLSKK